MGVARRAGGARRIPNVAERNGSGNGDGSVKGSFKVKAGLAPADEETHLDKHPFKVPFVCGCRDLGEATRRIAEGAAMIRTKGEAGTGNVVEAVRHARAVNAGIRNLQGMNQAELVHEAKQIGAPVDVLAECQK